MGKGILLGVGGRTIASVGLVAYAIVTPVAADSFSSTNYKIDASVTSPFGGTQGSTNYSLVAGGGGETLTGSEASTSYKLGHGYVAQLEQSIQLSITENPVSLGAVTPGISNTATLTANVYTDAPGYSLAIAQNQNLTSGAYSIPAVSGTIASPALWVEGTTKGLGFTQTSPANAGTWGSPGSYKYAAFPGSATTFYARSGYTGGVVDTVVLQPRLDVASSQPAVAYSNTVTLTATLIP